MMIEPGSTLGPYEIVASLGAGGMGEVWKARDPRIGREVAIKVLRPARAGEPELVRRFEQEARTVGQLNHPNLLAVYDVGEEGGTAYLVTELLEGETLRQRLAGGPLPAARAVEWAAGIASGLAAAHDKGIVHRDLKPENLFVTRDNRVKILDFGLARLTHKSSEKGVQTQVRTSTGPGTVIGTVGYMSPEQVRAEPVDPRSDIFSFGAVLYEMLAGERPFDGDSSVETMHAILKQEPPDLASAGRGVPPGLERIVRHCLEKHPEARFQSASDLAFDLEALAAGSGSEPAVGEAVSPWRRLAPAGVLVSAVALAALAVGWWAGSRSGAPAPFGSKRWAAGARLTDFERLTFRSGNILGAVIGPDGRSAVFSASWGDRPAEVYTVGFEDRVSRPLGLEQTNVFDVSSKGELAVVLKEDRLLTHFGFGTLATVPLGGGTPRPIMAEVRAAAWGPDGESLVVSRVDEADNSMVLEYPLGTELYRARASWLDNPVVSPDGERVAFTYGGIESGSKSLGVVDRQGRMQTLLEEEETVWKPLWISDELILVSIGGRASYLVDLAGNARIVHEAPGYWVLDAAADGTVLAELEILRSTVSYGEAAAPEQRDLGWLDFAGIPLLTATGQVVFTEWGEGGGPDGTTYLRDVDGGDPVRLGAGWASDVSAAGDWVLSIPESAPGVVSVIPTGVGRSREVRFAGVDVVEQAWFVERDRRILVEGTTGHGETSWALHDLGSGEQESIDLPPVGVGAVSPDGTRLAYSGADEVVRVQAFDGSPPEVVNGSEPGDLPIEWREDGLALWVATDGSVPMAIHQIDLVSGERTLWRELAPENRTGLIAVSAVSMTPDGGAWAFTHVRVTASDLFTARLAGLD